LPEAPEMSSRASQVFHRVLSAVCTVFNSLFQTTFSYITFFTKWDHGLRYTSIAVDILWLNRKNPWMTIFQRSFFSVHHLRLFGYIYRTSITQKSTECYYFFFRRKNTLLFTLPIYVFKCFYIQIILEKSSYTFFL